MPRRLPPLRKEAEIHQCKCLQGLFQRPWRRDRRIFLETAFKPLCRSQIRALEMLNNFNDRPPVGITARVAFGAATARGVFDNLSTGLQMRMHQLTLYSTA